MNGVLQNWKEPWHRATRNRATALELEAIDRAERMRLADDIGLAGRDLRRLHCTHSGPTELMPKRLQELGVDPAYVKYELSGTYHVAALVEAAEQSCAKRTLSVMGAPRLNKPTRYVRIAA